MTTDFWTDELTRLARLAVELVMTGGREADPELVAGLSPLAFWLACFFLPLGFSPLCLKDRERETHLPFTKWDMREHWMVRDHHHHRCLSSCIGLTPPQTTVS